MYYRAEWVRRGNDREDHGGHCTLQDWNTNNYYLDKPSYIIMSTFHFLLFLIQEWN